MFNPSVIKHNHFDAHIATAKHCGTHWVKYMLSHVLAEIYNLPEPAHIRDDSIIGHPKNPPMHKDIPQIAITHSHPHYLMRFPAINDVMKTPRCVFIVRNPKDLLVATYEKSKGEYIDTKYGKDDVSFSEYLRCDISKRLRLEDLWGFIRFFNAWGAAQQADPKRVHMIKYEDLMSDTHTHLKHLCTWIGMNGIDDAILETAIKKSSKEEMRKKLDTSESQFEKTVNIEKRNADDWFSEDDTKFFDDICARYLKYDFGYIKKA